MQVLCNQGRIPGLTKFGKVWAISKDAEKLADVRKIGQELLYILE
ncbi:hypothetical protein [Clostridium sp. KNHs216]